MSNNPRFEAPGSPLELLDNVPDSTLRRLKQYSGRLATEAVTAMQERLPVPERPAPTYCASVRGSPSANMSHVPPLPEK